MFDLKKHKIHLTIIGGSLIILTILLLCLIGNNEEDKLTEEQKFNRNALHCATLPTLDCLPIFVAYEDSIFSAQQLDIILMPFQSGMDCDTALVGGSAQIGVSDVVRAQRLIRKRVPLDFLSATNQRYSLMTNGKARIRTIKDFDDKLIAITRFSATDFLAEYAIDSVKLNRQKVYRAQINDLDIRVKMLVNKELDGALLPEPQATEVQNMKSIRCADFHEIPYHFGAIVLRSDLTKDSKRKEQIKKFRRAYDMAVDSINKYGLQHYGKYINKYCHVKTSTIDSLKAQTFTHIKPINVTYIKLAQNWLNKH
ncbi:MAG: ABC transporter substrate-binding protein [Prevotella sp.]|nr:ABC transporter substrate-binding protein [Candidatus Equicola stercoris]